MTAPRSLLRRAARALPILALAFLAACEDGLGTLPEDRLEGLVILEGTREVLRYSAVSEQATGSIDIGVGETRTYIVMLLTRDGSFIPIAGNYVLREPAGTGVFFSASKQGTDRIRITGTSVSVGNTVVYLDVSQGIQNVISGAEIPIRVTP